MFTIDTNTGAGSEGTEIDTAMKNTSLASRARPKLTITWGEIRSSMEHFWKIIRFFSFVSLTRMTVNANYQSLFLPGAFGSKVKTWSDLKLTVKREDQLSVLEPPATPIKTGLNLMQKF